MQQQKEDISLIIPPPLRDSEREFHQIMQRLACKADSSTPCSLPATAFPLPCLVGHSANRIARYAEKIFWTEAADFESSPLFEEDFPFCFISPGDILEATHFCPVAILHPADAPFGQTTKLWLYTYLVCRTQDGAASSREAFPDMTIQPLNFQVVPSLSAQDLQKAWATIFSKKFSIARFRSLLVRQAYLLYGVVPSFFPLKNKQKIASPLDFLFDSETTLSLHPSVANWWTCALHRQVDFLSSEKGSQVAFPTGPDDPDDMAFDFFCEQWESEVKNNYWKSSARVESFRTRLFLPYSPVISGLPNATEFRQSAALLGLQSHGQMGQKYCSVELWKKAFYRSPTLQPVEILLRPFYQQQRHPELLQQNLYSACNGWQSYAAANCSRTFFVCALLAAAYSRFCPEPALEDLSGMDVLNAFDDHIPLVVTDPETVSSESKHPLLTSQLFWKVFHIPANAPVSSVFSKLRKVRHKLCILRFDGSHRVLTQREYDRLLCCSEFLLLWNATPPQGVRHIPVTLRDLGFWTEEADVPADTEDRFPSAESFAALCMIADRVINRLAWVQANHTMLRTHLNMRGRFLRSCASNGNICISTDFLRYFKNSLERHKNPPEHALAYLDETILRFLVRNQCSTSGMRPYQPFLRALSLLGISPFVLRDSKPDTLFEVQVNLLLPAELQTSMEYFYPLLPLRSRVAQDAFSGIWKEFLVFLQKVRQKNPPYFCQSKEDYLAYQRAGAAPLGWESEGRLYLNYDVYWEAFLKDNPYRNVLSKKQNKFQREILAVRAGPFLHRDDAKSGRWYCRFTTTEQGKQVRIGKFLVIDSAILTGSANDRRPRQN